MLNFTKGKQNKLVSFFMGLLAFIMLALGWVAVNAGSVRAKAADATEVDITDTLSVANWGIGEGQWWGGDNYFLYITDTNGLQFNDSGAAYWNDHPENADKNNGCDIMEYIYVNGVSARELSNRNAAGTTSYSSTSWPLSAGTQFAPVSVYTEHGGSCIQVQIMTQYVEDSGMPLTVTFKKGFQFLTAENELLTLSTDVMYQDLNDAWARTKMTTIDTTVTAFGDPDTASRESQFLWFTLSENDYVDYNIGVHNTQLNRMNLGEKIRLTIGGVEKTLGEYTTVQNAELHKFARAGRPLVLHTSIVDYTTIEKVVIEAGCEFPSQATAGNEYDAYTWYKTTEDVTFVNDGTGAFYKYVPNNYIDTTVTAFGDPDTANRSVGEMWFTLSNHDYTAVNAEVLNTQLSALNLGSKIKITVDGVETTLAENNLYAAYLYRFMRANNPIALYSSITNYTTIDSITIEAGCEFPSYATASATEGFTIYRTTADVTFVNDGTGAFYKYVPNNYIDTTVTAFGDPGFVEDVGSEVNLWFTLSTHDYVAGNNLVNATQMAALNSHSKIKITVGGVEKTLSEYTVEAIYLNKWGRAGSPLAMQLSSFDYRTIEKITVEKGCEFPSQATASATEGFTLYRTTADVTFYNQGDGTFSTEEPARDISTSISGVQLRGSEGNTCYLVLQTNEYASVAAGTAVANPADYADLLNNIKFYMSKEDRTGVLAADICSTSDWVMNTWSSGGLMIPVSDYETYSGSSVYKIAIEGGITMPYQEKSDLIVNNGVVFKNDNYGVESAKYGSFVWSVSSILALTEMTVTGVQLRAEVASGSYYLVLITSEYASVTADTAVSNPADYADLLTKIRFYMSTSDEEGVSAADICLTSGWTMNKWDSGGLMIAMSAENYETYSGSSVYKVMISDGAILPYTNESDLTTTAPIVFKNNSYGNDSNKYGSFDWIESTLLYNTTTKITGVQLRAEVASGSYYLVLQTNEYAQLDGEVAVSNPADYADLLSKITFYTSAEDTTGISAADICLTSGWTMNKWGSFGLMITMTAENYEQYSGSSVYKITIEQGAIMPCVDCNLVVKKSVSYSNDNYGSTSEDIKYGSFVWSEFNYTLTLMDGETTVVDGKYASYVLPELDPIVSNNEITQVLIGWTTNTTTFSELYPAGYEYGLKNNTTLYAVWIGFEMQDGAAVRLVSDSSGIRFLVDIRQDDFNAYDKSFIETWGVLLAPTDYLSSVSAFTHSALGANCSDKDCSERWKVEDENEAIWTYAAAFTKIQQYQYARSFSARGYLKINYTTGVGYVYTAYTEENNSRSIYEVATEAYKDEENPYYKTNETILGYVNNVADITLGTGFAVSKNADSVGSYTVSGSASGTTITITVDKELGAALVNGERVASGRYTPILLDGEFYSVSVSYAAANGETTITLTFDGALEEYLGSNLFYQAADETLAAFLNDFAERNLRYNENSAGYFPVSGGTGFAKNWEAMGLMWHNATEDVYGDKVNQQNIYNHLESITQDGLGMIYNSHNGRESSVYEIAGDAALPQGWPFPSWYNSTNSAGSHADANLGSTAFEFNGITPQHSWQYNKWVVEGGTFAVDSNTYATNVSTGDGYAEFATGSLQVDEVFRFYRSDISELTRAGGVMSVYSPFIELALDFNATNLEDYYLIWKTKAGGATWFSAAHNEYATTTNSSFATYSDRCYLEMYHNENWDNQIITAIGIEFRPKSGTALTVGGQIDYIRCQYDTRQSNATLQWLLAFSNYIKYTNDTAALEALMPKARNAMLFLTHTLQGENGLLDVSYLYGHNGIGMYKKADGTYNYDTVNGVGNGYWDLIAPSQESLESNIYFYQVLLAMADLEERAAASGLTISETSSIRNRTLGEANVTYSYTAESLAALAATVKSNMEKDINPVQVGYRYENQGGFWCSSTGRFAAGINEETGVIADYGYVYWNLEAICAGIGTDAQQLSIMQWIDGQRTVSGDTSTGDDIYFYEFAPRFNTKDCYENLSAFAYDNVGGLVESCGTCWSKQLQNGGAAIAWSYYDLVARAKVLGVDNAYERLQEIQTWYEKVQAAGGSGYDFYSTYYDALAEEANATEKNWSWSDFGYVTTIVDKDAYGTYNLQQANAKDAEGNVIYDKGPGAIGLDAEFIESITLIKAIPDMFFGMESESYNSITFTNNIPSALTIFQIENMKFGDCVYSLRGTKDSLQILNVTGAASGTVTLKFAEPATDYKVYVDEVETSDYTVEGGMICVTVDFGNVCVKVK